MEDEWRGRWKLHEHLKLAVPETTSTWNYLLILCHIWKAVHI